MKIDKLYPELIEIDIQLEKAGKLPSDTEIKQLEVQNSVKSTLKYENQ